MQRRAHEMAGHRTIITISNDEKRWLSDYTKRHGISMAEAVRRGIACLKSSHGKASYQMLLDETKGIWTKGNGLKYQEKMRQEWDR
jgi:hypothetical protein